jgi:hypothetical protein
MVSPPSPSSVGSVYLADDIVDARRVALKLIDIARLGETAIRRKGMGPGPP